MTWGKLDDAILDNVKVASVGWLGFGLYAAGLVYCNRELTNGNIPRSIARTLLDNQYEDGEGQIWTAHVVAGRKREEVTPDLVASWLVAAGLWEVAPGGYVVHDFLDPRYNRSKERVLADRARTAERVGRYRRNGSSNAVTAEDSNGGSNAVTHARATTVTDAVTTMGPVPAPEPDPGSELGSEVELGTAVGEELPPAASAAESDPFDASRWEHLLSTLVEHRGWPESGRGACTWKFLMLMRQRYGSAVVISALCDVQLDRVPPMSTAAGYFQSTCERFSAAVSA